ncbi:hypothetical protein MGYG_04158 [Nannizzia gypsea CBS 118893]|uniref:Uncharacterized protein n=1 Tax=Arthroderma gypseum (strain ATCC MYA-4604 / CBS 118893) TaxID=535722 RepID=E4UV37_ARTGP|nr:hypothetical protein MGYG_04158 [Nannizzia gypsea CBS 118893]EFR01154.1 hypothetical protein MGYG_04158 [Nannizzia gypsea CBS 118893]
MPLILKPSILQGVESEKTVLRTSEGGDIYTDEGVSNHCYRCNHGCQSEVTCLYKLVMVDGRGHGRGYGCGCLTITMMSDIRGAAGLCSQPSRIRITNDDLDSETWKRFSFTLDLRSASRWTFPKEKSSGVCTCPRSLWPFLKPQSHGRTSQTSPPSRRICTYDLVLHRPHSHVCCAKAVVYFYQLQTIILLSLACRPVLAFRLMGRSLWYFNYPGREKRVIPRTGKLPFDLEPWARIYEGTLHAQEPQVWASANTAGQSEARVKRAVLAKHILPLVDAVTNDAVTSSGKPPTTSEKALTPETSAIKGSHVIAAIGYSTLGDKWNTGGFLKGNASRKQRLLFSVRRIREWGLKICLRAHNASGGIFTPQHLSRASHLDNLGYDVGCCQLNYGIPLQVAQESRLAFFRSPAVFLTIDRSTIPFYHSRPCGYRPSCHHDKLALSTLEGPDDGVSKDPVWGGGQGSGRGTYESLCRREDAMLPAERQPDLRLEQFRRFIEADRYGARNMMRMQHPSSKQERAQAQSTTDSQYNEMQCKEAVSRGEGVQGKDTSAIKPYVYLATDRPVYWPAGAHWDTHAEDGKHTSQIDHTPDTAIDR